MSERERRRAERRKETFPVSVTIPAPTQLPAHEHSRAAVVSLESSRCTPSAVDRVHARPVGCYDRYLSDAGGGPISDYRSIK